MAAVAVVGARRWIHHAQLELVPVIVAPGTDAATVVAPPAGVVVARMIRDVQDAVSRPDRPRLAVLTFDDGPYPVETPALAQTLVQLHVPATFFLIGVDARRQPAIARRLVSLGMEIGDHTLTHPQLPALSYDQQLAEIALGRSAIAAVTGVTTHLFRPPHGDYTADTLRAAAADGDTVVLWDVDPGDWRTLTPQQVEQLAIGQARAPAVILLHNGKDPTIEALPAIVAAYRRAGFTFVTLAELQRRVPLDVIDDPAKVTL
ncbi:MAG TPA: polysaccharide deacetylase family protein [Candidatus Eremiobacteraceae bacterium]|nr:polysaccharide deacetylase family protein [Candidatus Eremiobacteraceae bacterium]